MLLANLHHFDFHARGMGGGVLLMVIVITSILVIAFWPGNSREK